MPRTFNRKVNMSGQLALKTLEILELSLLIIDHYPEITGNFNSGSYHLGLRVPKSVVFTNSDAHDLANLGWNCMDFGDFLELQLT